MYMYICICVYTHTGWSVTHLVCWHSLQLACLLVHPLFSGWLVVRLVGWSIGRSVGRYSPKMLIMYITRKNP